MKKRVSNVIIELLLEENIKYIFGITGKAISPLIDAILDYESIDFISSKHESGAALMAYGYAQGSSNIGVCCGTTAGGSTNLATGVATAYMNSIPLLVITGQISTFEYIKGAFQESTGFGQSINTVDFFKPITKESFSIITAEMVVDALRYAIKSATSGRMGPVHVSIPFNIQLEEIEYNHKVNVEKPLLSSLFFDNSSINETLNYIKSASKPVFLIGWGGVLSGANIEIIHIAEKLKIPIATTLQGKGAIPTNHPLCLGIMGVCGHQIAADYIFEESDLIIAVGTSFGEFTSFNWDKRFLKDKNIIQIDIDSREIGKNYPVAIGLVGDAKVIIHHLKDIIDKSNINIKNSGLEIEKQIKSTIKYFNSHLLDNSSIPIKPQRVMNELANIAPDNTIFLADSGSHWAWAMHYLPICKNGGFYPAIGLGAMGASICSSIGVKLGKPNNPVICICGDGSFLMNGNEIVTAEQFNIAVIWVILNDSKYNMPEKSLKKMFNRTIGVTLSKTNFLKVAEAYNVKGYRVENPNELQKVFTEALTLNKPVVIDIVIDPEEVAPFGQRKL
ncbi:MAG: thiamine pyrophosphate-binding protein [Bacteroidota bacterium]